MPVTFEVDEVVPAPTAAATIPLRELVGEHAYLGIDPELRVLDDRATHPLIGAVHHAFADHRPLVLSPDAIWLTIAQGVAQHVRIHAEALRSRLVAHAGKQVIEIALAAKPQSAIEWAAAVTMFRQQLGRAIGEGRARLLTCDFSTTGDAERIASEVVLMDALSSYYDYRVTIVCGIPHITLLGTVDDWKQIRTRIDVIAELDLGIWASSLARIADQLVAAAAGKPDVAFFQRIYKPRHAYGWDRVTGWIARLYPYIRSASGDYSDTNPLLAIPFDHVEPESDGYFDGPGIRTCDPPASPSRVVVRMTTAPIELVTIEGGLLAIEQTPDGELVPRAGYLVRQEHGVASLIERLRTEHGATAGDASDAAKWHHDARLRALFEAIATCTIQLGDATWTLRPPAGRTEVLLAEEDHRELVATCLLDLGDGTTIAIADDRVVRLPMDRVERLEAIPVLAGSFVDFLARTLREGIDLRSTTSLMDVMPEWWDTKYHAAPLLDRLRREGKLVDAAEGDSFFGVQSITVGSTTWRRFEPPPEWRRGPRRSVHIAAAERRAAPVVDLGDGTLLACVRSYPEQFIVRIERAPIEAKPVSKKAVNVESSQAPSSIPILGRSIVEVLTYAVEHGVLPKSREMLADFVSR